MTDIDVTRPIGKTPGPNSRPARRASVIRKSILLDLSAQGRITKLQAAAALALDADLEANTGRSLCKVGSYEPRVDGGGHGWREPQIGIDHDASDRIDRLTMMLHPHERDLLGQIIRLNFVARGGIAALAVETCYGSEQLRNAAIIGRVQALLDTVAVFYRINTRREVMSCGR